MDTTISEDEAVALENQRKILAVQAASFDGLNAEVDDLTGQIRSLREEKTETIRSYDERLRALTKLRDRPQGERMRARTAQNRLLGEHTPRPLQEAEAKTGGLYRAISVRATQSGLELREMRSGLERAKGQRRGADELERLERILVEAESVSSRVLAEARAKRQAWDAAKAALDKAFKHASRL